MSTRANVITYQSPSGKTVNITVDAGDMLTEAGIWPRDAIGGEYSSVSHGLHYGRVDIGPREAKLMIYSGETCWPELLDRIQDEMSESDTEEET